MTPEEVKLWVNLKVLNNQGYNFRRQVPVDGYISDFVEFTQRLIIEVDGSQRGEAKGERRDKIRDAHFVAAGFQVLRFWNIDVNTEMDGVIHKILSVLKDPPPALRATSPARGRISKRSSFLNPPPLRGEVSAQLTEGDCLKYKLTQIHILGQRANVFYHKGLIYFHCFTRTISRRKAYIIQNPFHHSLQTPSTYIFD